MRLSSRNATMSGRDSCGFDVNTTATSAIPSSSACTPASATRNRTNELDGSTRYTRFKPGMQFTFSGHDAGAANRTRGTCARAAPADNSNGDAITAINAMRDLPDPGANRLTPPGTSATPMTDDLLRPTMAARWGLPVCSTGARTPLNRGGPL